MIHNSRVSTFLWSQQITENPSLAPFWETLFRAQENRFIGD